MLQCVTLTVARCKGRSSCDTKHLMNISRISEMITGRKVPSDEEIWAA
jgi:hypothetical protein